MTDKRVPSSPAQRARGRLIEERGQVGLLRHCLTIAVEITGDVSAGVVQDALDHVVDRHPALRSVFPDGWTHHVVRAGLRVPLDRRIVTGVDPDERWAAATAFAYDDRMRPFDLTRGPLMRATLLSAGPHRHLLVLSFDQLVIDAHSTVIVIRELVAAARSSATGEARTAAWQSDGYLEIRRANDEWLRGPTGRQAVDERRTAVAGATVELPWRRRPDTTDPDELAHHALSLPDEISEALLARVKRARTIPFAAALAAFALVATSAGSERGNRHAVTSMFAARSSPAEQTAVGWLANRVAIVTPPGTGTFHDLVHTAHREIMTVLDRQHVPCDEPPGDALTVSLLHVPASLGGGDQTELPVGDATWSRRAVSFCPTGADVDLFVVEGVFSLAGERPRLAVGGTGARDRVGQEQLTHLVSAWAAAMTVAASVAWETCSVAAALDQLAELLPPGMSDEDSYGKAVPA